METTVEGLDFRVSYELWLRNLLGLYSRNPQKGHDLEDVP